MPRARVAGVLLVILGVLTLGTGTWLGIVFRTWGGFVAGFAMFAIAVVTASQLLRRGGGVD